ncbi:MAG: protein of unknown function DUF2828 [Caudoviricetes sp.]|nr:MAG: protein of unknown function DUF2828 [Caudoviricetes sp.]
MNTFLEGLKKENNKTVTENGATQYKSTLNKVLDLFALGGSYRNRSEEDCITLFKEAFEEDKLLAVKCLFYLRDCRGGASERRFFRVCFKWLADEYPDTAIKIFKYIPEYGRYDDLYCMIDTPLQNDFLDFLKTLIALDLQCDAPSLAAKWMPSENASSAKTKELAKITRNYFGMTSKEYRKTLSKLRKKIKVLEGLMSQNKWDEIDFGKIPSKAGMKYKTAFSTREETKDRYIEFIESKETKVNASVLCPHDIAREALIRTYGKKDPQRAILQKYWDNLPSYYNGREETGIAVVDVSGSMEGIPMDAAISLGAYIAERGKGLFANHFITFSENPDIVEFKGDDIVDKMQCCKRANWGFNTNIEAVFDLLLDIAKMNDVKEEDIPERVYIFSDMEFDRAVNEDYDSFEPIDKVALFDRIKNKWYEEGYRVPDLVFWNLDARSNQIPCIGEGISYVSGFSPAMIECVLGGKTGWDLCLEKLNSERYASITI